MAGSRRYIRRLALFLYREYRFRDYAGFECIVYHLHGSLADHYLVSAFYKSEKASKGLIYGSLLALMGVGLIVFNGSFVLKISPIGDLLTLLAALSWAFYSLIIKKMAGRYPTVFITRKIFFYGVLTILPAFLLHPLQPDTAVLLQPGVLFNLLFLAVLASLICYVLWNVVLKQLGTVRASNYIYLNPLVTMIASSLILDEKITLVALGGAACIVCGVYWAEKK